MLRDDRPFAHKQFRHLRQRLEESERVEKR
jgi:hypothetical protein